MAWPNPFALVSLALAVSLLGCRARDDARRSEWTLRAEPRPTASALPVRPDLMPAMARPPVEGTTRPRVRLYGLDADYRPQIDDAVETLAPDERVAALFVATIVANECEPMAPVDAPGGVRFRCSLTEALGVAEQCGQEHRRVMSRWLGDDAPRGCVAIPITAYQQTALTQLFLTSTEDEIVIEYEASGTMGPGGGGWTWRETLTFSRAASAPVGLKSRVRHGDPPGPSEVPAPAP